MIVFLDLPYSVSFTFTLGCVIWGLGLGLTLCVARRALLLHIDLGHGWTVWVA